MAHPIADSLLDQAREHLAKSDFANAAKSARAVLALDSENSDANDILKASEAAIGADSANDESVIKNNLKLDLTRLDDEQLEMLDNLTEEQLSAINVPPTNPHSRSRDSSKSAFGLLGFISGVVGLFFFPIIFGPIGIILGAIAATDEDSRTLGMIVIITSTILMILGMFWGMAVWEESFYQ